MHELSMCEGVVSVVLEAAQDHPVTRVRVRIGDRWGVSPESFDQSFQMAAQDTLAAGALIEQQPVAGEALVVEEIELAGGTVVRNPEF